MQHSKKWQREYYKKNKEKLRKKAREWLAKQPQEYKRRQLILSQIWWRQNKELILKKFGNKCNLCGDNQKKLHLHSMKNENHSYSPKYYLKHLSEFVLLCTTCHLGVHFCDRVLHIDWDKIKRIKERDYV